VYIAAVKQSAVVLFITLVSLPVLAADEQTVTVTNSSLARNQLVVKATSQGTLTQFVCFTDSPDCSEPSPGEYSMVRVANATDAPYQDCTNVVLYKSSGAAREKVGVYCWPGSGDCYIFSCSPLQVETFPVPPQRATLSLPIEEPLPPILSPLTQRSVSDDPKRTFTGYPPAVYMQFFQPCSPDTPCTRTDDFHVDPLPKGCCVLLATNGDGQGKEEVRSYEVFLNGESVLSSSHARNASANVVVQMSNTIKVVLTGERTTKVFVLIAYDPRQSK
jgi:hypothetical protein